MTGAKGVSPELLVKAIKNGIAKVNVDSDLRIAFSVGVREALNDKTTFNPRTYLLEGKNKMKEVLTHKVKNILNSAGRG